MYQNCEIFEETTYVVFTTCSAIFSRRRDLCTTWEARNQLAYACAFFLVMTLLVSSCSSLCFRKVANVLKTA